MAALRTQIYLDRDLRRRVDRAVKRERRSMSEIIRSALRTYLEEEERARRPLDPETSPWIGAWKNKDVDDIRSLRAQDEKRAKRLGY